MKNRIILFNLIIFLTLSFSIYSKTISILGENSTRDKSMAGLSFLTSSDSSAIFNNASMLLTLQKSSLQASYTLNPQLENNANISYSYTKNNLAFGIGTAFNLKEINKYNFNGENEGSFLHGSYLAVISGAIKISDSYLSINLKAVVNTFEDNKIDAGGFIDISYMRSIFLPNLRIGLGIKNLGFYQNTFGIIDTKVIAAIGYKNDQGTLSVTTEYSIDLPSLTHHIGAAFDIMVIPFNAINNKKNNLDDIPEWALDDPSYLSRKSLSGMSIRFGITTDEISLGLGFNIYDFRLDYSLEFDEFSISKMSHSLGVNYYF